MNAHRLIPPCPASGNGVHNWLMQAGWACRKAKMSKEQAAEYLQTKMTRDPSPHNEVEMAVEKVFGEPFELTKVRRLSSKQSPFDPARRAKITKLGLRLEDLIKSSPRMINHQKLDTEEIIDALFPGDPLLCCGQSSKRFKTQKRSVWRGKLSSRQFIVPNPMNSIKGLTEAGRESYRAKTNTGPRRFLIIEQDMGSLDDQAGVLLHLAKMAPLALVVFSGGKSLHGWFFCAGESEGLLLSFMDYAVSLGADPATRTPSQMVRMPNGIRDNGKQQSVYYFNPGVMK
jgi:hypothetical protein